MKWRRIESFLVFKNVMRDIWVVKIVIELHVQNAKKKINILLIIMEIVLKK